MNEPNLPLNQIIIEGSSYVFNVYHVPHSLAFMFENGVDTFLAPLEVYRDMQKIRDANRRRVYKKPSIKFSIGFYFVNSEIFKTTGIEKSADVSPQFHFRGIQIYYLAKTNRPGERSFGLIKGSEIPQSGLYAHPDWFSSNDFEEGVQIAILPSLI